MRIKYLLSVHYSVKFDAYIFIQSEATDIFLKIHIT